MEPQSPNVPRELSLAPAELARVFPFHFVVDARGILRQVGASLARIAAGMKPGESVAGSLAFARPERVTWETALRGGVEGMVCLRALDDRFLLRGELVPVETPGGLAFLGTPWMTDPAQVAQMGLSTADFAPHDPTLDLLELLQSHQLLCDDLRTLAEKMASRGAELKLANERLASQNDELEDARRRLERQEAESRKLALVASRTDNAVVVTDALGRIEWVNEGFTRLTGYELGEVQGRKPGSFLQGPGTDPAVVAMIRERLHVGDAVSAELLNYHKTGNEYWVSMGIQAVRDADGRIQNFMAVERDITEQRATEAVLRETRDAAEAANRAKSEFLAVMSHEIRTPMNGILGMTAMLRESKLDPKQRECLEAVWASSEAMLQIVNDILDLSRIEARKLELENAPFELRGVIDGVLDLLGHRAESLGLELSACADATLPAWVVGDAGRLRQVLINLVGNAIKFTEKGAITLEALPGKFPNAGCVVHFEVRDTGIGMNQDQVAQLFRWYSQVGGGPARQIKGTGLGLAISARLVELMGGSISVESQEGRGTTFSFDATFQAAPARSDASPIPRNLPVLVFSPGKARSRALEQHLQYFGGHVVVVETGFQAWVAVLEAKSQGAAFAVAIVDVEIPRAELEDFAFRCRQDPAMALPAFVALTPLADPMGGGGEIGLTFAERIFLPVRASQVRQALVNLVGSPQSRHPARRSSAARDQGDSQTEAAGTESLADLNILVAEDHEINRRLVQLMLESLGCKATYAANGREVLELLMLRSFDVILMDCQMPELDGFETARQIRLQEGQKTDANPRGHHVRIIAMTAHALVGDRERCLEAGMDDYLSKPLRLEVLQAALRRVAVVRAEKASAAAQSPESPGGEDERESPLKALRHLESDFGHEAAYDLAHSFVADTPKRIDAIGLLLESRAPLPELRRAAHSVKGSASIFAAKGLCASAQELEDLAEDGAFDEGRGRALIVELRSTFARLKPVFEDWMATSGGAGQSPSL